MSSDATASSAQPPRRVFPIYAKILLLFFLNILLVAGGAFWMLRTVFDLDRELLIDRNSRERLQLLGETLAKEFRQTEQSAWDGILEKYGQANRTLLGFYSYEGERLAGAQWKLPERIRQAMGRPLPPPAEGGAERRNSGLPPRREFPPEDDFGVEGEGPLGEHRGPDRAGMERVPVRFHLESAKEEGAYWFVIRLPPSRGTGRPNRPPALVGRIAALGESNLLFNPKPWFFAGLGVLVVSALLWLPLVRSATKALRQMSEASARIAHGQFDVRVDERRRDELGQLGSAINQMTQRLAGLVSGQKRFLGDIAHELCSPLARMEMALSVLEQKTPEDLQGRITDVREEVREMSELVSELLSFSKAGWKAVGAARESVAVADVIQTAVSREAAGADVLVEAAAEARVLAVPALLARALGNLLRNAVRYAGDRGAIEITVRPGAEMTEIAVADHGPGVGDEDLPRLFDPFFRADPSRTRETGGVGLGLAIVKSCIESSGGLVSAANRTTGGLVVTISLPTAS